MFKLLPRACGAAPKVHQRFGLWLNLKPTLP